MFSGRLDQSATQSASFIRMSISRSFSRTSSSDCGQTQKRTFTDFPKKWLVMTVYYETMTTMALRGKVWQNKIKVEKMCVIMSLGEAAEKTSGKGSLKPCLERLWWLTCKWKTFKVVTCERLWYCHTIIFVSKSTAPCLKISHHFKRSKRSRCWRNTFSVWRWWLECSQNDEERTDV